MISAILNKYKIPLSLLFLFLFISSAITGQTLNESNNLNQINKTQKTDTLLWFYKNAINKNPSDPDNFSQLGLIYFRRGDYMRASENLRKSYTLNREDQTIKKYLYWSFLYAGLTAEKRNILRTMTPYQLTEISGNKPGLIEKYDIGGGFILSNNINKNKNALMTGKDTAYGSQILDGNMFYQYFGTRLNPSGNLYIYFAFQQLQIERLKQEMVLNYIATDSIFAYNYNNHNYFRKIYSIFPVLVEKKFQLVQQQFYISTLLYAGNGFSITGAYHFIRGQFFPFSVRYSLNEFRELPFDTINTVIPLYRVVNQKVNYTDKAAGIFIRKSIDHYQLLINCIFSDISRQKAIQYGASAVWYPYGNANLYLDSKINFIRIDKKLNPLIQLGSGFKLTDKLWMETGILAGNNQYSSEYDLFTLQNGINRSLYQFSGLLLYLLKENIHIHFHYRYSAMQSSMVKYKVEGGILQPPVELYRNYTNHSIIFGLIWNI